MFESGLFMAREELDLLRFKFGRGAKPCTTPMDNKKRSTLDRVFIVCSLIRVEPLRVLLFSKSTQLAEEENKK